MGIEDIKNLNAAEKSLVKNHPVFKAMFKEKMAEIIEHEGISLEYIAKKLRTLLDLKDEDSKNAQKVKYNVINMLFKFAGFLDPKISVDFESLSTKELQEKISTVISTEVTNLTTEIAKQEKDTGNGGG